MGDKPQRHTIEIGPGSLDEVVTSLMLSASAVLHERFPVIWVEAMTMLASRIQEHVRHNETDPDELADG